MTLSSEHIVWLARLLVIWLPCVLLVRLALSSLAARVPVARRVLIVGEGTRAAGLRRRLAAKRHALFEPMATRKRRATAIGPCRTQGHCRGCRHGPCATSMSGAS